MEVREKPSIGDKIQPKSSQPSKAEFTVIKQRLFLPSLGPAGDPLPIPTEVTPVQLEPQRTKMKKHKRNMKRRPGATHRGSFLSTLSHHTPVAHSENTEGNNLLPPIMLQEQSETVFSSNAPKKDSLDSVTRERRSKFHILLDLPCSLQ